MKVNFKPKGFQLENPPAYKPKKQGVVCKYCNQDGLTWLLDPKEKRYRLYDALGNWHSCKRSY